MRPDLVRGIRREAGTTLVELMMALMVFAIFYMGALALWRMNQEATFRGTATAEAQQNARAALEHMVRELRQADAITSAAANGVWFRSVQDANPRAYTLSVSASPTARHRLLFTNAGPPDCSTPCPIADYIIANGLQLSYRDAAGAALSEPVSAADLPKIRRIDIALQGQMVLADPNPPFMLTSTVHLRNR